MLEVRDLVKIYASKGAEPVRAIDGVSIRFEETGMVFLLGKSGKGKRKLRTMSAKRLANQSPPPAKTPASRKKQKN